MERLVELLGAAHQKVWCDTPSVCHQNLLGVFLDPCFVFFIFKHALSRGGHVIGVQVLPLEHFVELNSIVIIGLAIVEVMFALLAIEAAPGVTELGG